MPYQALPQGQVVIPPGTDVKRHLDAWLFWVPLITLLITLVAFAIHVINTVRVTNLENVVESTCGPGPIPLFQTRRASNRFSLPSGSYLVSVGEGGGGKRNVTYFCHGDLVNGTLGYFMIHEGPPSVTNNPVGGEGGEQNEVGSATLAALPPCCTFIRDSIRWEAREGYAIDPSNNRGLSPQFIASSFDEAVRAWEMGAGSDVFGERRTIQSSSGINFNGANEVAFGRIDIPGFSNILAVTGIWMDCPTRDGSGKCTSNAEIIEWDQLYNTFSFDWGDADVDGNSVVDLLNIATHEMGHSLGLGDLYSPASCRESTMWGFSGEGETKKRSLDPDDSECAMLLYSDGDLGEPGENNGSPFGTNMSKDHAYITAISLILLTFINCY